MSNAHDISERQHSGISQGIYFTAYQWNPTMFHVAERSAIGFNGVTISVDAPKTSEKTEYSWTQTSLEKT